MEYLPDLIREGAEMTRQRRGTYVNMTVTKTCVLGAAAVGAVGPENDWTDVISAADAVLDQLKSVDVSKEEAPTTHTDKSLDQVLHFPVTLSGILLSLNDTYGMDRTDIADWLKDTFDRDELMVEV